MNVYLYVLNTLSDWEIGYLTAEINSGRYLSEDKKPVTLIKIGSSCDTITTMGGIKITPEQALQDIHFEKGDVLILPGGDTWLDKSNEAVINLVPKLLSEHVLVAAICGATVALAHHGILNDKRHTSNDESYLKSTCPRYTGEKHYVDAPSVVDHNLITATGLAPLEFSYEVFKQSGLMAKNVLEAWYGLFKTRDLQYYSDLVQALEE